MAESDGQERTEDPTGRRLSQAKEKGQIPRSKEAATAAVLVAGMAGLMLSGRSLGLALLEVFRSSFSLEREAVFDPQLMIEALATHIAQVVWPMLSWFAVVLLAAILGSTLLGGLNFSSQAMMPKLSKLNPMNGIKRMFGVQALVELLKSIAKVTFIGTIAALLLRSNLSHLLNLSVEQLSVGLMDALDLLLWIGLAICCSLLPIVAIDVPFQVWNHTRQLKMTKQEVKDEYKDIEGKPEVKGRIRRMQYEMANRRMMAEVPKADVVVTNPTHYAVALKYDRTKPKGAPVVVAKGVDEVAMKIREIAREHKITQVASPALARAIYHTTKLEQEIPDGLFMAVAQILAYVFQLQAYQAGKGNRPTPLPDELPIPNELRH
ncbi:flagellar biosynthesis protein FlhB [Pseudaeromonas paramecii]|uniref:Flagellar biosynthetic protein FlhB n=1 Tax=Pseudaeromonas paramecii TaxID=2138166 RepID=A0ABP8Q390_9GAMM